MESENPYESPQSDPRPSDDAPLPALGMPTWRFPLLAAIAIPAIIFLLNVLITTVRSEPAPRRNPIGAGIATMVVCLFAAACALIVIFWKSTSQMHHKPSAKRGAVFVRAAIWILALVAIPSAFVSVCAPVGYGVAIVTWSSGDAAILLAVLLGVAFGVVGSILTGRLAYNLWLDALGRPKALAKDQNENA